MKNLLPLVFIFLLSCNGRGMGAFKEEPFPVSKRQLSIAIDSFYKKYPEHIIPKKWDSLNNWSKNGYDFLDSRIFYFKTPPEEMYYVSFKGDSVMWATDSNETILAVRAVCKGPVPRGDILWLLQQDCNKKERERIENRFHNEIVSKLNEFLDLR